MTRPFHGSELRGLSAVSRSPSFEGRFGRMFRNLPPLLPDDKDLEALARQMVEPEPTGEEDTAGDNPDIPAGFTYFGQFVDHDLTFDPTSQDRKSTRLNSSHLGISYAVFCLKKKK